MRTRSSNGPIAVAALLLALLLPLQGFAAVSVCAQRPTSDRSLHHAQPAHEHCGERQKKPDSAQHHGSCCDCCLAAASPAVREWILPRTETPQLHLPPQHGPLMIALDRLERPPRTT